MQDQYFTFNMFDAQAWYVRDVILGKIQLPAAEQRGLDIEKWRQRHATLETPNESIDFQAQYVRDLINATDYPDFPIEKQAELLKSWLLDKQDDIMGFRNKSYRSTITGTMASKLPKPWLDIKDDSLEGFMSLKFDLVEESKSNAKMESPGDSRSRALPQSSDSLKVHNALQASEIRELTAIAH